MAEEKKVQVIERTRKEDVEGFYELACANSGLNFVVKKIENRIRAIPNGYRDARLCLTLMDKLVMGVLETFTLDKKITIARQIKALRYQVYTGPMASKPPDMVYIHMDDLTALVDNAHEVCKLCAHPERCKTCKLGKALDRALIYERKDGSWQDVDVDGMG